MAIVNTLKIYEILRPKLQDEPARAVADVIEKTLEEFVVANLFAQISKIYFVGTLLACLFVELVFCFPSTFLPFYLSTCRLR
ncbi:MAG: hypothetical protein AB1349_06575 [Elusimicrobiota bacterium]